MSLESNKFFNAAPQDVRINEVMHRKQILQHRAHGEEAASAPPDDPHDAGVTSAAGAMGGTATLRLCQAFPSPGSRPPPLPVSFFHPTVTAAALGRGG